MQEDKIVNMYSDKSEVLEKYFKLKPSNAELKYLYSFAYNNNLDTQTRILKEINDERRNKEGGVLQSTGL